MIVAENNTTTTNNVRDTHLQLMTTCGCINRFQWKQVQQTNLNTVGQLEKMQNRRSHRSNDICAKGHGRRVPTRHISSQTTTYKLRTMATVKLSEGTASVVILQLMDNSHNETRYSKYCNRRFVKGAL